MLVDHKIRCPLCSQTTTVALAKPELDAAEERGSFTGCRHCNGRMLIQTLADGAVFVVAINQQTGKPLAPVPFSEVCVGDAPSPFTLGDVIRVIPSIWKPRANLVHQFDHRPEWIAELQRAIADKQSRPRPLSIPRRIFVSYRWGSRESDEWVAELSRLLSAQGNNVVFDRDAQTVAEPVSVPELVSRIADCHFFIAVLDQRYVARIEARSRRETPEGWVWDEFQTALAFSETGYLQIIGMLREDLTLPPWFRPFVPRVPGNTFDVRGLGAAESVVAQFFPRLGSLPDPVRAVEAAELLHRASGANTAGDLAEANRLSAQAIELLPNIPDAYLMRAETAYKLLLFQESLTAAESVLAIDSANEEALLYAAAACNDMGRLREALSLARRLLERNSRHFNARFILGEVLQKLGHIEAAIAHLENARRGLPHAPQIHYATGKAYRSAGQPESACACFEAGLKYRPDGEPLLVDYTAALIECGRQGPSMEAFRQLIEKYPNNEFIQPLAHVLNRWLLTDEPPPPLIETVSRSAPIRVHCRKCGANVGVHKKNDLLCAGCGAVRSAGKGNKYEPCTCCGCDGFIQPALTTSVEDSQMSWMCPYCDEGALSVEIAEHNGTF